MAIDHGYYQQYYFNSRTGVSSKLQAPNRQPLLAAHADDIGLPVKRILDMGCGTGMLRAPLKRLFPHASYTGVETSEYLCRRYGWDQGVVENYRTAKPFDLVVCYDVVQYLDA